MVTLRPNVKLLLMRKQAPYSMLAHHNMFYSLSSIRYTLNSTADSLLPVPRPSTVLTAPPVGTSLEEEIPCQVSSYLFMMMLTRYKGGT